MKHTPGPWKAEGVGIYNSDGFLVAVATAADYRMGIAVSANYRMGIAVSANARLIAVSANARLIAAAPELLESLQTLVDARHSIDSTEDDVVAARAAIAKATGETI